MAAPTDHKRFSSSCLLSALVLLAELVNLILAALQHWPLETRVASTFIHLLETLHVNDNFFPATATQQVQHMLFTVTCPCSIANESRNHPRLQLHVGPTRWRTSCAVLCSLYWLPYTLTSCSVWLHQLIINVFLMFVETWVCKWELTAAMDKLLCISILWKQYFTGLMSSWEHQNQSTENAWICVTPV